MSDAAAAAPEAEATGDSSPASAEPAPESQPAAKPVAAESAPASPAPEAEPAPASAGGGEAEAPSLPENWREILAGGDKAALKELGRVTDPSKIGKTLLEQKKVIRSAETAKPLPEDADEKQVAEWRAANGIPEAPEGYFEGLPDGLVIGEEDKAGMEVLAQKMHAANQPPAAAHAAMQAYYEHVEKVQEEVAREDSRLETETEETLREEWGNGEYRANMNDLRGWLQKGGVEDSVMAARTPDGVPLGSNPEFLRWAVEQMRVVDPYISVVGAGGGDPYETVQQEIDQIEEVMRTDFKRYSSDAKMQQRYLELQQALSKRKV